MTNGYTKRDAEIASLREHVRTLTAGRDAERQEVELKQAALNDSWREASALRARVAELEAQAKESQRAMTVGLACLGDAGNTMFQTLEQAADYLKRVVSEREELREMHSQVCAVAIQYQRERDTARDAALEEAAQKASDYGHGAWEAADAIHALKAQPARRFVEAERPAKLERALRDLLASADCEWENREQGHDWAEACQQARHVLGVSLDEVTP